MGKLQRVNEHGEIRALSSSEAVEGYRLETFGGIFSLTRKPIINDDLGALAQWGAQMGRSAAETEADQLVALLLSSPVMGNGRPLFHAEHGNLAATGGALSEATLSDARLAMRMQTGLDGASPVNVAPRYLLVSPALETAAEKLLATLNPATVADQDPFAGALKLLVEPRLPPAAWHVFADPAVAPVIEFAYLASAPGPQMASRDGWGSARPRIQNRLGFRLRRHRSSRRLPQRGRVMGKLADLIAARDGLRLARLNGIREVRRRRDGRRGERRARRRGGGRHVSVAKSHRERLRPRRERLLERRPRDDDRERKHPARRRRRSRACRYGRGGGAALGLLSHGKGRHCRPFLQTRLTRRTDSGESRSITSSGERAMAKPKDVCEQGDEAPEPLFAAVAMSLSRWEVLQNKLANIFAALVQ
jgi:hypothetical protein